MPYAGSRYEKTGTVITKYYFAGSTRIAMPRYNLGALVLSRTIPLYYLLSDHLGSTSLMTNVNGVKISEMRYKPFGELRYTAPLYALTRYTFTGQYSYMDDPTTTESEGFGLMFYNARWYDPVTGRFAQPDTLVPTSTQGTQAWDRYAFVNNNPVKYSDSTGHEIDLFSWPNPFTHDTLTISGVGMLKEIIGVDLDVSVVISLKDFKDGKMNIPEISINVGSVVSGGLSSMEAAGLSVLGSDGSVLAQASGSTALGGEVPVNVTGCIVVCVGVSKTYDLTATKAEDVVTSEGYFVGMDPAKGLGIDVSVDVVSGSDFGFYFDGTNSQTQIPFLNKNFWKRTFGIEDE